MKKAGTGQHNEVANMDSLHVCGNREKSAHGTKECRTYPYGRGLTSEKHWLQKNIWGFRPVISSTGFPS